MFIQRPLDELAYVLRDLPVELLGRIRSDRVMLRPAPSREEFPRVNPSGGRPPRLGGQFAYPPPPPWPLPSVTNTSHYGKAKTRAWGPPASPPHPPRGLARPSG